MRPTLPSRHLHTFVPLPSSPNIPSLASHGGIPTHMVLNPEPNLRPLSIRRGPYPIEESHPLNAAHSASARAESSNPARLPAESIVGTPATDFERESRRSFKTTEPGHPRNHEAEARPKKKQRTHDPTPTPTHSYASHHAPPIQLCRSFVIFLRRAQRQMILT